MSNSATDTLEAALESIATASSTVSNDIRTIARWLMVFRVEMRIVKSGLSQVLAERKDISNHLSIALGSLEQVEFAAHEIDVHCCGELGAAQAHVDNALEFCRERSAQQDHQLTDPEVRRQVLAMTDGRCTYCATIVSDTPVEGQSVKLFVEHVVPASKGGPNHLVNYVPSCGSCNSAKGDRHVLHFVRNIQPRRQEASSVVSIVRAAE